MKGRSMPEENLQKARVTSRDYYRCLQVLAAANHYQWIRWQQHCLPILKEAKSDNLEQLFAHALESGLEILLAEDAATALLVVDSRLGPLPFGHNEAAMKIRKYEQARGWLEYARTLLGSKEERWLLQARMPFLQLTGQQQQSDYMEAVKDLRIAALDGGCVLPSPLPEAKPDSELRLASDRILHGLGMHGDYMVPRAPWKVTCLACHTEAPFGVDRY